MVPHADFWCPARDGYRLRASRFGTHDRRQRVVLINSATATPRQFYRHFAGALANAGFSVICWDYRGVGDSAPGKLRGFRARMRDWVLLDMAGVVDWVTGELEPESLFLVGHSAGGQLAGMLDTPDAVDGMVTVSAQSAYWRKQGGIQKAVILAHSWLTLPVLSRLVGYLPWSLVGGGVDIPKGVAIEWARWCRDPQYLLGDKTLPLERYPKFKAPVLAYSIEDDPWGTPRAVDAMMRVYPNIERRHLVPSEYGLDRIGHLGFFRPGSELLWQNAIEWLDVLAPK